MERVFFSGSEEPGQWEMVLQRLLKSNSGAVCKTPAGFARKRTQGKSSNIHNNFKCHNTELNQTERLGYRMYWHISAE